jgi:hypothetical protein
MDNVLKQIEDAGRGTDTIVGHLTDGEIVIPLPIIDNKDVKEYLINIFDFYDIDIDEFTVGNKKNKINPKTGYPEFKFSFGKAIGSAWKAVKNVFGGGGGKKNSSGGNIDQYKEKYSKLEKQMKDDKKKWEAQRKAEEKKAEAEKKRLAAEQAKREKQEKIDFENRKAADIRRSSESNLQQNFRSTIQNQQAIDQQSAQSAWPTPVGGSGYDMATAQQQKIAAAGGVGVAGGVAGPAASNAPGVQAVIPSVLASNVGTGGTQQATNRFTLPTATGLQFGGM